LLVYLLACALYRVFAAMRADQAFY